MKPTPADWPRISAALFYADPRRAIDWLCEAFGFRVRILVESRPRHVEHSELEFGEGLVMIAGAGPDHGSDREAWRAKLAHPAMTGGLVTANLCVYVDDVDVHCERARRAGAEIVAEPRTTDYGPEHWVDRGYACRDIGAHVWWFLQRISTKGAPHGA